MGCCPHRVRRTFNLRDRSISVQLLRAWCPAFCVANNGVREKHEKQLTTNKLRFCAISLNVTQIFRSSLMYFHNLYLPKITKKRSNHFIAFFKGNSLIPIIYKQGEKETDTYCVSILFHPRHFRYLFIRTCNKGERTPLLTATTDTKQWGFYPDGVIVLGVNKYRRGICIIRVGIFC